MHRTVLYYHVCRPIYGDHKSPHPQCPHVSDNINDGTLHYSQQAQVLQVIVIISHHMCCQKFNRNLAHLQGEGPWPALSVYDVSIRKH